MASTDGYTSNSFFSMRNIIIYIVVALVVYGAIYLLFLRKDGGYMQQSNSMSVTLAAQNDSTQAGTATLTEKDGKTTVSVTLTNPVDDSPQPAHIHSGACPTPGEVVYPLTNLVGGKSETVLDVPLATLKKALPLAINIHKSEAESSVYISCGDLK